MGAHLHSHKLLALAVFVDSLKSAYVRSVHVHEENVGSVCAIQQDFLLDPGKYKRVTGPVMLGSFRSSLSSVGLKQSMGTIIKMQQNEGWHCFLEYRSDSPSETLLPCILTPSKNADLKDIPSLEQDLKVVESVVLSCNASAVASGGCFGVNEKSTTTLKESFLLPPSLALNSSSSLSFSDHSSEHIPGLETPDRMLNSQQFDIWHNWGSDLELASPKASLTRAFFSDQGHNAGSPWNPSMMLDLNLDLPEFSAHKNEPDCALVLSTPAADPKPLLNIKLGTPSRSLQQSSVTDEYGMDFSALDSFADSRASYKNVGVSSTMKLNAMQNAKSLCSEDSHGSVINMFASDTNGNSSTSSSDVHSTHDKSVNGSQNTELNGYSCITSRDMCSTANYKNVGDKGQRKQSSTRACSNGSMQSMREWIRNVESKPRNVRPGSTSERITDITLHELSQYFSMPITQAAKELNVGLTVLKKRCREFRIPRWPHRKMKSINSLIDNIQDLAEDQGVKSSHRVLNAVRELEEQKRLMEEMPGVELAERTKKLRQACFKANYKRRRLGMMNNINNAQCVSAAPQPLSTSVWHPFGVFDLNPTVTFSTPQNCYTKDHFL